MFGDWLCFCEVIFMLKRSQKKVKRAKITAFERKWATQEREVSGIRGLIKENVWDITKKMK